MYLRLMLMSVSHETAVHHMILRDQIGVAQMVD